MKEQIFKLENQLSQPSASAASHFHYHDNRTIVLIQGGVPMDLNELTEPIQLMWFNRHNPGKKFTPVLLGKQSPKKDMATGEFLIDLMGSPSEKEPSIKGIFPRHLSMPTKRQRCW